MCVCVFVCLRVYCMPACLYLFAEMLGIVCRCANMKVHVLVTIACMHAEKLDCQT